MKRKITFLSAALMLLAFLAVPLGMRGQTTHTIGWGTASGEEGTYTNFTATSGEVAGVLSFITEKNSSQTNPAYNANASELRLYFHSSGDGGSITISPVSGITITDAVMTTSTSPSVAYYVDGGSAVSVSASNNTYTISGISASTSLKIQNVNTSNTQLRIKTIALTYTTDGTQPTTYTVTYHANVTGIDDVVDTYNEGANVTLRAANTFTNEGYTFEEWNTDATGDGDAYEAGYQIEGIDEDLEFYAIWTENTTPGGDEQWVLTSLTDLTENDVFVIVGNNGSNYAMKNDNGTGNAPATVDVTIANDAITGTVADNIQWTVSGNANDGYTFYPNGSTETWLYCTNTNNGVRVGTNSDNTFKIESGYLFHQGTSRYVGIYNSQDWRCYTSINSNIQGQTFAFYKKVTGGVTPPSIIAGNVEISYETTSGSISYSINNEPDPAGTISAEVTDGDWLTLGETPITFTCTVNEAATERTATVRLTYSYGVNQTVTKDVTVTQLGDPNVTPTIAEVRAQSTGSSVVTRGIVTSITGSNMKTAYIQDATAAIVVYGSFTAAVGDEIRVSGSLSNYNGLLEITSPQVTVISSGNTIEPQLMTVAEAVASENQGWYIRIENAIVSAISGQNTTIAQGESTIVVRGISGVEIAENDVISLNGNIGYYNGNQIANPQNVEVQAAPVEPSITVTPATLNVDAEEHLVNYLDLAYENIDVENASSFTVHYYNAEGEEIQLVPGEAWMIAGVTGSEAPYRVLCVIIANEGEARTAYFKVSAVDAENNTVYSNLVTVSQEAYVAPTYAELPFAFNSGRAAIEETEGLSQEGLGSDYGTENTKLKFDSTGDWLLLQFNERPGTLTFDIKGNSFNGSTFTVQTSEDGETFTDLKSYTNDNFGNTVYSEEFTNLDENVRYIKWIYTEKVSGNVGLGNIALDAYEVPVVGPSITITPDNFEVDANAHMVEYLTTLAYENIVIVTGSTENFGIQYYDAEGNPTEHSWCGVSVSAVENSDDFQLLLILATANTSNEARTAYFKVFGHDAEDNLVYSNLVTITQAAPDYAVLPFEWDGGASADFLALNGVTAYNLGSDYAAGNAPYLIKFDGTGDYIQVKCDQQPGKVTIGVKMIGGDNTSTITIQGSADGETFTDIEVLTISGEQNDVLTLETTNVFGENDRYVRMLFTKGSNVGVGPITIEKGNAPSITVTPSTVDFEAAGQVGETGYQTQYLTVTYNNLEITKPQDFAVQFYNAEGEEQTQPSWITPDNIGVSGSNVMGYMVMLLIAPNEGPARSAYFKVYALGEDEYVYSNLVTINQAGVAQQYTLTVEPFENLELITFVNDQMVMEADGETQANEGDQIMLSIVAAEGYVMETLMVNGVNHVNDIADDFTYTFEMPAENVTISATAVEDVPPTPGEWVMVSLNDLTEDDVFVIVGVYDEDESSFAMPNNGTNAPSAVDVTMVGNTLAGDIAENLKWNLSIGEDGYTFYPNGETESWLYCTSTNNGVRVGTNENNVFSMTTEGYLFNNATERYIGIYNSQDWRCYTSINNNIKEQTFAFYKRVDESEIETYTLDITGYGNNEGGYYLIASPVSMIRPTAENGFLTDEYDLYYFDQAQQGEEWRNYKAKKFFPASGKGYLYASQESTMLIFTGVPYNGNGEVALDYTEGASFAGWNLIGNPFGNAATIDKAYYRLNADGSEVNATTESSAIAAMEGVFVVAETVGETVTFTEQTNPNNNNEVSQICINVSMNRGESIDRAIVRFDNGNQLPKFQLNPNHTKVYFPQGENDYAIVRSANEGEMPVNFKAENNGTYTISINTENVEMNYLHLIDNMTGTDVDLLANPSYSFEAKTTDYANRFRLVFNANTVNENGNETFAYFNGSEWVISNMGEATLQVVDLMGRVLSTETVNGNATMNLNQTPGVYMLRLVNGDSVKVQKVVVR